MYAFRKAALANIKTATPIAIYCSFFKRISFVLGIELDLEENFLIN